MTGIDRISRVFEKGRGTKLMAHAVCGYPDMAASARILGTMASAGADLIEAQLPFSDPSADGRSIVEANYSALRAGSTTAACLSVLEDLRRKTKTPILVMSYLNPILACGVDALIERLVDSGLDGLIIPDFPDDEPELRLAEKCADVGLALVPLIAPTTSLERASALARDSASPFLYAILRLGVTGRKTELDAESLERLAALKESTGKYLAAGFGIRERAQIAALGGVADCAIVGSALVDAAREAIEDNRYSPEHDPAVAVERLLRSLKG